jgi:hypothetical protein
VTALSQTAAAGLAGGQTVAHSDPTGAVSTDDSPLAVNHTALQFRDLRIGGAQSLTVTVLNTSDSPQPFGGLVITGAAAGDFKATTACLPRNIPPHRTCSISVRFTPTAAGVREAELHLFDVGGPGPVVTLVGAGH